MTKDKRRKRRRNACPICAEPRHEPGLPLTVPLSIPTYWSPDEALAIFQLLDEMRLLIAAIYGTRLTEAARQQYHTTPADPVLIPDEELPF